MSLFHFPFPHRLWSDKPFSSISILNRTLACPCSHSLRNTLLQQISHNNYVSSLLHKTTCSRPSYYLRPLFCWRNQPTFKPLDLSPSTFPQATHKSHFVKHGKELAKRTLVDRLTVALGCPDTLRSAIKHGHGANGPSFYNCAASHKNTGGSSLRYHFALLSPVGSIRFCCLQEQGQRFHACCRKAFERFYHAAANTYRFARISSKSHAQALQA